MSRFPKEFIDDLCSRTDIVDVIGDRVKIRKAGKEYIGLCPFHNEKTPSFTVSPAKQFYHCFGCGAHGDAIEFVQEHDGMGFVDAVEALAQRAGIPLPERQRDTREEREQREEADKLYGLLDTARKHFVETLKGSPAAIEYAKSRGLTGKTAKDFGIGFAAGDVASVFPGVPTKDLVEAGLLTLHEDSGELYDKFRQRLMFPILDEKGRVIGFGGRIVGNGKPKYLNSPESRIFHKGTELYGLYQAKQAIRQGRSVVVLEGYMDVAMLHQHGEHRAVAALGTSLTEDQVRRLYRMVDEIIFCFDGDRAGQAAAARAARIVLGELVDGKTARFVSLPEEHDPDSFVQAFGLEAWKKALVENGKPLSAKITEMLTAERDLGVPEDRAAMVQAAQEYIELIGKAPTFRQVLAGHFEKMLGVGLHPRASQKEPGAAEVRPQRRPEPRASNRNIDPVERVRPDPARSAVYTNLSTLCAMDMDAVQHVPLELMDDCASMIVGWFSIAPNDGRGRVEALAALPSTPLRPFLHIGVQRAEEKRGCDSSTLAAEIRALVEALTRVGEREKKRSEFDALFG